MIYSILGVFSKGSKPVVPHQSLGPGQENIGKCRAIKPNTWVEPSEIARKAFDL